MSRTANPQKEPRRFIIRRDPDHPRRPWRVTEHRPGEFPEKRWYRTHTAALLRVQARLNIRPTIRPGDTRP